MNVNNNSYELFHSNKQGQLWVINSRIVEWVRDGKECLRKYIYTSKVLKAGFIDWEFVKDTLTIVLEDCIHVYFLKDGDSFSIKLPFIASNAFFYKNGVLIERQLDTLTFEFDKIPQNYKFITVSDPLVPFGSISFTASNQIDLNKLKILHFPEHDNYGIAVLYDDNCNQLHFYCAQVFSSEKNNGVDNNTHLRPRKSYGSLSSGEHLNLTVQRRRTSDFSNNTSLLTGSPLLNGSNNPSSIGLTSTLRRKLTLGRRSASANTILDSEHLPVNSSIRSGTTGSYLVTNRSHQSLRTGSNPMDRLTIPDVLSNLVTQSPVNANIQDSALPFLSKEGTFTKIMTISTVAKLSKKIRIVSLRFEDNEGIIFHDLEHDWGKIWIFHLNSSLVGSMKFKAVGYSPISLVKTIDIKSNMIIDIAPYISNDFKGYISLLLKDSIHVSLYNPFLDLTSPNFKIPKAIDSRIYYISESCLILDKNHIHETIVTFPTTELVVTIFNSIEHLLSPSMFHYFIMIWQLAYSLLNEHIFGNIEYNALEYSILCFLIPSTSILYDTTINDLQSDVLFQTSHEFLEYLPNIVMCLHLIREEFQLNLLQTLNTKKLDILLYKLTCLMGWPKIWTDYYQCDKIVIHPLSLEFPHPLDEPPSILKSLYSVTQCSSIELTPFITFSRLVGKDSSIDDQITPRTSKLLKLFESFQSSNFSNKHLLNLFNEFCIIPSEFETYPIGIYSPLKKVLTELDSRISLVNSKADLGLLNRPDFKKCLSLLNRLDISNTFISLEHMNIQNHKVKTISQIYGLIHNNVGSKRGIDEETISTTEKTQSTIKHKLFFHNQGVFDEALNMITYSNIHQVYFENIDMEYTKLLDLKKKVLNAVICRVLTSGIASAGIFFASEKPLHTEKPQRKELNLNFQFISDNTKLSIDRDKINEEYLNWGEFHQGVAQGIKISKSTLNITSSWINYNKPASLDAQYGGFLLGLGLDGHLKVLEEWQIYNFLSPKITHVSIGLLLGLCASLKGTMDLKLTKVLSVHIVALLPPGSTNLNLHHRVQTAGLIGIGLLYQKSQHRRMCDLLYSQITSFVSINGEQVPDEGYRLAAGIALGLVTMGAGKNSIWTQANYNSEINVFDDKKSEEDDFNFKVKSNFLDTTMVENLISLVATIHDVEVSWVPDNSQLGALTALMLMFLKTNAISIANKVSATFGKENGNTIYYKPEIFLYRELAYHMIMWDNIQTDLAWILSAIPSNLSEDASMEPNSDTLPIYYRLSGRVLAIGLKYASSNNIGIRNSLLQILDRFLPVYQHPLDKTVDSQLMFKGISMMVNIFIVALSLIMCGTSDIEVFRRVRYLHNLVHGKDSFIYEYYKSQDSELGRNINNIDLQNERDNPQLFSGLASEDEIQNNKDPDNHYGKYLATNLALGFLFLGLGHYAVNSSDVQSLSYLLISVLPIFMPPHHLQEIKYLWTMSVDPRFLMVKDSDTDEILENVPLEIRVKGKKDSILMHFYETSYLLPNLDTIKSIKIVYPAYYPLSLEFTNEFTASKYFSKLCVIYLKRREELNNMIDVNFDSPEYMSNIKFMFNNKLNTYTKIRNQKLSERLCERLGLKDIQRLEFEDDESQDQKFNLDMMCSNGDTDYQLELWRRRHGL